jgi:hypothetical protein
MIKLYRSAIHPRHWIAYAPGQGWVAFPMVENGWQQKQPARGLDPVHLRQVPLHLAENTGVLQREPEFAEVA